MNIGRKVPIQINLVDYCTDTIQYSAFFLVEMDKLSLMILPCTYQPVACSLLPTEQVAACQAGEKVWTDVFGCPKTNTSTSGARNETFYEKEIGGRICNSRNYCKYSIRTTDHVEKDCTRRSDLLWMPSPVLDVGNPHHDSVPYCVCNWNQLQGRINGTKVTTGVPDGFIKDGTSTFYVQASSPVHHAGGVGSIHWNSRRVYGRAAASPFPTVAPPSSCHSLCVSSPSQFSSPSPLESISLPFLLLFPLPFPNPFSLK